MRGGSLAGSACAIVRSSPYIESSMLVKHVVHSEADGLTVLQALADPVRLEIVRQLARCTGDDELRCGTIEVPVTKSTASHHFKTPLAAGIIAERGEGTRKYFRLRRA